MSSQKLSVYNIKTVGEITWSDIIERVLDNSNDQERFIITEESNEYIGGCYLLETYYNQTQYNVDEGRFELLPTKRLNILKFDVFLSSQTLILWGGKKIALAFLTAIERASNQQIIFDYKTSDFKKMIGCLINNSKVTFTKMKIIDVVIEQGIVADCIINLNEQDDAKNLVKRYLNNISQMCLIIGNEELSVSMAIYSTGSVVVYRDRDDVPDEAMNVISQMFGGIM